MVKPIYKMYLYVIVFQSIAYALIFYIFETISTTNNPTRFMIFWVPVVFSVFVSFLLVKSMITRIRRNGVKYINYKNYIVSATRNVTPPLLSKKDFRKEIEKDGILEDCSLTDIDEHRMKLSIQYSIFFKEYIFIDFEKNKLKLCAKPNVWYIYGPYGGGIQKLGYLESVIQDHYNKNTN
ncbi:hypothetical protein [Psychroflexus planctonicus]|uniref:Uncharacterized protein n=1 Tax=Psychroflexus planctonicus TaxID=1526575 RepID=A0ABQ1SE31_9FLAO|nr:hypothetical protein [Psychroflexus planctonicus]GGE32629.1 hypothetical protein GCM10010832_11120 [Psychroflexus planctonicus]